MASIGTKDEVHAQTLGSLAKCPDLIPGGRGQQEHSRHVQAIISAGIHPLRDILRGIAVMRNIVVGLAVSLLIATVLIVPTFFGISTWKIVLGAIGLALILLSGRKS